MNEPSVDWLRAGPKNLPPTRLPSWIPHKVNPTIVEEPDCTEACQELEEMRTQRDDARRALEAKERDLRGLMAQIEALHRECAALKDVASAALAQAERARAETLATAEPDLIRLASAIAERVVARELTCDPGIVVTWAKEGITALHTRDDLIVALSLDLFENVARDKFEVENHHVDVVPDERLPPGSCEVRTRSGRVEENVTTRISAVLEALGSE